MSALTEAPHSSSLGAQAAEGSAAARTYSAPSAVERGGGGTRAAARGGGAEKHKLIQYKEDEVAISEDPQQRQRQCRPLSFSRWFAREARATDVFVVLVEVLIINWLHAARLGEALHCGEGGAAAGSSSGSSSSGSSSRGSSSSSSSGSSPFPCGGGLWSKLLWSLSSGAVLDPVLRLQMWDYSEYGSCICSCWRLARGRARAHPRVPTLRPAFRTLTCKCLCVHRQFPLHLDPAGGGADCAAGPRAVRALPARADGRRGRRHAARRALVAVGRAVGAVPSQLVCHAVCAAAAHRLCLHGCVRSERSALAVAAVSGALDYV